jgi:hypothetical protein
MCLTQEERGLSWIWGSPLGLSNKHLDLVTKKWGLTNKNNQKWWLYRKWVSNYEPIYCIYIYIYTHILYIITSHNKSWWTSYNGSIHYTLTAVESWSFLFDGWEMIIVANPMTFPHRSRLVTEVPGSPVIRAVHSTDSTAGSSCGTMMPNNLKQIEHSIRTVTWTSMALAPSKFWEKLLVMARWTWKSKRYHLHNDRLWNHKMVQTLPFRPTHFWTAPAMACTFRKFELKCPVLNWLDIPVGEHANRKPCFFGLIWERGIRPNLMHFINLHHVFSSFSQVLSPFITIYHHLSPFSYVLPPVSHGAMVPWGPSSQPEPQACHGNPAWRESPGPQTMSWVTFVSSV